MFATGEILPHLLVTGEELALGYFIGVACGVLAGYGLGRSPRLALVFEPYVIMGMRMAIPYAVIGVIVGEFTSSVEGLGLFIHEASSTYDPAGVFAGIAVLLAFVVGANMLASRLERRVLRWQPAMAERQPEG